MGRKEAFFAAIEAGADAVYLGLQNFSARARANNFYLDELPFILEYAHKHKLKVYLTLNTLIKNRELLQLFKTIYFLDKLQVDAIIFQDWAVYYLVKKFFPSLTLHASTQMGFHNSLGANFAQDKGIKRLVLSREITKEELIKIRAKSQIELEMFVHGALCYSFSGACLFSSFLGGFSGNRGQCKQPCRRAYRGKYLFNLSDLELIKYLSFLKEIGIDSLKIEGRMKSAEYVYAVVKAYKNQENKVQDFGREKSAYFFGGDLKKSIIPYPYIGELIGKIVKVEKNLLKIESKIILEKGMRLRILRKNDYNAGQFKLNDENLLNQKTLKLPFEISKTLHKDDKIFLVGAKDYKVKEKFKKLAFDFAYDDKLAQKIFPKIWKNNNKQEELFLKIDTLNFLQNIDLKSIDKLILDLDKTNLEKLAFDKVFLQKFSDKLIIEIPDFISENSLDFYQNLLEIFFKLGIKKYLCYKSQENLFSQDCLLYYKDPVMNDLAANILETNNFFYPQEGELQNDYRNQNGIYPLFFTPKLFYSRCPIENFESIIADKFTLKKVLKNGFTIVYPNKPVSILEEKQKLLKKGYYRFLLDLSFCPCSKAFFDNLMKNYQGFDSNISGNKFNFKRGLK